MPRRRLLPLLACFLVGAACPAEDKVATALNRATESFETAMERHFRPVRDRLDRYCTNHRYAAARRLVAAMQGAGENDRKFLAYHLLTIFPRHKEAAKVYGDDPAARPIDPDGRRNPAVEVPQPDDAGLLALVRHCRYPPFAEVRQEVVAAYKRYNSRAKQRDAARFYVQLQLLCQRHARMARPVMAFYFPTAKEAKGVRKPARPYLNPLDRYLLDRGLSAIEAESTKPARGKQPAVADGGIRYGGDTSYRFPIPLANCRVEVLLDKDSVLDLRLEDRGGRVVTLGWRDGKGTLGDRAGQAALVPAGGGAGGLLEVELRGRQLVATLDGLALADRELPAVHAITGASVGGGTRVGGLAVRLLAERAPRAAPPVTVKQDEPWRKELQAALAKPVTVSFDDQQLTDVVASLKTLTGKNFVIDPSAAGLADVPLSFVAEDMQLVDVLKWLKRMADLDHRLTEQGIVLEWRQGK